MHAPIHVVNAQKIDENDDSEVVEFTDKHNTRAFPDDIKYAKISNLKTKAQINKKLVKEIKRV